MNSLNKLFNKNKNQPIENEEIGTSQQEKQEDDRFDNFPAIGVVFITSNVGNQIKEPTYIVRLKPEEGEYDSGFMVFENKTKANNYYTEDIMIVAPQSILKIDKTLAEILLKAPYGSAWEKQSGEWQQDFNFEFDQDYLYPALLTNEWYFVINELFERSIENERIKFTTNDKTIYAENFKVNNITKEELLNDFKIDFATDFKDKIIEEGDLSTSSICRYYFEVTDVDDNQTYNSIHAIVVCPTSFVQLSLHYNNHKGKKWAIDTLKSFSTYHQTQSMREISCVDYIEVDEEQPFSFEGALQTLRQMVWHEDTFWVQDFENDFIQFHGTEEKGKFDAELKVNVEEQTVLRAVISYYEMIQLIQYYYENNTIGEHPNFQEEKL